VKTIYLMRHAEREDRAIEKEGKDWISTAPRPHDPRLSIIGLQQAANVGLRLKEKGITKILASPLVRAIQTAQTVAVGLELGPNSVCVEEGLVEQAKSFRGKTADEPRPNWNPLLLPPSELCQYSDKIDLSYRSLVNVTHRKDESAPNTVMEVHPTMLTFNERDLITAERCNRFMQLLETDSSFDNLTILCVGHGASLKYCTRYLEAGLEAELCIQGDQNVSCFAGFTRNDAGKWQSMTTHWSYGKASEGVVAAENMDDRGDV